MNKEDLNNAIYKILDKVLPAKFPFIDGVKDVILTVGESEIGRAHV